jgi:hypothetical protein
VKVTVGLILSHGFPVPAAFVVGYSDFMRVLLTGEGNLYSKPEHAITEARVLISHDFPVDVARNTIVRMFLDADDGDALLFLDTDMKHPASIAHSLVRRDKDIVTGRYQMRRPPFLTVAMRKTGDGPRDYQSIDKCVPDVSGLLTIDAAGAGALLIKRPVLEAIRARIGDDWFRYQVGADGFRSISEDMWFFEQAKAAGFQAYLDADTMCSHIGQFEIDAGWAPSPELMERAKNLIARQVA